MNTKWVFKDNIEHYFRKNRSNGIWEEFENGTLTNSLTFRTYALNSVILYNNERGQYVELNDTMAKMTTSEIESLDITTDETYQGYWDLSDGICIKINLN